jgi:sugar phosphate isomerase/epimerase
MPTKTGFANTHSRRSFLSGSAMAAAAILTNGLNGNGKTYAASAEPSPGSGSRMKRYPIGLELYSVRGELARDLPNTLRTVAKIGYELVEFYAPYSDWSFPYAKDVRAQMNDLGLRCYSTHNHFNSFVAGPSMAKAIELNQILGTSQVILSSAPGGTKGADGWKRLGEQLTVAVEQLKPHGLSAGFHNHQTEWVSLGGGQRIMDVLAENTPNDFILQLDVGTCMEAGADPVAWVKAHPGRIKSVHLKEWAPGTAAQEKGYRVLFGEGVTPWKELIAALESGGGVEFYLLEQEGSRFSEFETARRCLDLWKKFRGEA